MKQHLLTTAAPRFSAELLEGLRAIGCHELAEEVRRLGVGQWAHDTGTGALTIQLLSPVTNFVDPGIVATGYGRSLPLRLPGTVLLDLDNFGRVCGLEIFDREDVLEELRASAL